MKKFVLFFLAIGLLIPLFSVPTSAASYYLGDPSWLTYMVPNNMTGQQFPYGNFYYHNTETGEILGHSISWPRQYYFSYSDYIFFGSSGATFGLEIGTQGYNPNNPNTKLFAGVTGDLRNYLFIPGLVYENLFLPVNGQYLKVEFKITTAEFNLPADVAQVFSIDSLCYLCDTSGISGTTNRYSLPKAFPTTSFVSRVGNTYTYYFYFNLRSDFFSELQNSENICLALRFPYYFDDRDRFADGVLVKSNCNIPQSYEILNIGGYEQSLADITQSINSLKTNIVDFYTDQSSEDIGYISRGQAINTQVTNSIGEYNEALRPLDSLLDDYTAPPAAQQVQQQLSNMDTQDVKRFFSVPWIVSALGLVFTFSVIRLILYGTKEG